MGEMNTVAIQRPRQDVSIILSLPHLFYVQFTQASGCCVGSLRDVSQIYEYGAPETEHKRIRNLKGLDYLYYAVPGSAVWKTFRNLRSYIGTLSILTISLWPLCFVFLSVGAMGSSIVEICAVSSLFIAYAFFILSANIQIVLLRLKTAIAVFDGISTIVVVLIVSIYGQGFVLYGAVYSFGLFVNAYTGEAVDVDWRLSTRSPTNSIYVVRQCGHALFLMAAVAFRICVFLKQVTVNEDIVLALLLDGQEILTLRDLWEFVVDVVVVRSVYLSISRLRQPLGTISFGTIYAEINEQVR